MMLNSLSCLKVPRRWGVSWELTQQFSWLVHWMVADRANSKGITQAWTLYLGHHCGWHELMYDWKMGVFERTWDTSEASGSLPHLGTAAGSMWWVLVFSEPCRDHDDKLSEVCLALLLPSSAMRSGPGDVSVTDTLLYSAVVPRHNEMKRKNPSS